MYSPAVHNEDRIEVMHSLIRQHPLGAMVTCGDDGPSAEHIPLVLHDRDSPSGTLRGHVAKKNPVAKQNGEAVEALIIFQGPQAYITPNWYPSKREHGKVVPTWNYAIVHAYGKLKLVHDELRIREHLETLTSLHEASQPAPWKIQDAPDTFIAGQLRGIVGVEITIDRLQGKWKVSGNKDAVDRGGVVAGLEAVATDNANAMAKLMGTPDS